MKATALVKGSSLLDAGDPEDRVVLLAFEPKPGVSDDAVEKLAWAFMAKASRVPASESDPVIAVENGIHRGPDLRIGDRVVKAGTWIVGLLLNTPTWRLYKSGELTPCDLVELANRQVEINKMKAS